MRSLLLAPLLAATAIVVTAPAAEATRGNGRVARTASHAIGDGRALARIGDLDENGTPDLAVGSPSINTVTIVFMASDGAIAGTETIGAGLGGFTGALDADDRFGDAIDAVGDVDGDGIGDLAVGAWKDDDFWEDSGAVWILFMRRDGTVRAQQKISSLAGGLPWLPQPYLRFGYAVAGVGDLDDDGTPDLIVGAPYLHTTSTRNGGIYVIHLQPDGTVKSRVLVSDIGGGFVGPLDDYDLFGISVASLGDFDGDGTPDVVVGVEHDDDGGPFTGALWLLMLHPDGMVKRQHKISATTGGLLAPINRGDHFGHGVTAVGDLDGDGVTDLAVVQYAFDNRIDGVVWVLFLRADGTVKSFQRIDEAYGGLVVAPGLRIGAAPGLAAPGDLDGDGIVDLAVGTPSSGGMLLLFGAGVAVPPCDAVPRTDCVTAMRARIGLHVDRADDAKDRLKLAWQGAPPAGPVLGDPTATTSYAVCLYDWEHGDPVWVSGAQLPAGSAWRAASSSKLTYTDRSALPDGVQKAKIVAAANGRLTVSLTAKGQRLRTPVGRSDDGFFTGDPHVTVQVVNDAGACWAADFTRAKQSTTSRFVAAAP